MTPNRAFLWVDPCYEKLSQPSKTVGTGGAMVGV